MNQMRKENNRNVAQNKNLQQDCKDLHNKIRQLDNTHCHIWGHCTYECRCQDDPNGSPSRELEETTRASTYHVAEHHPARSDSLQPHTERSSRPGSEPSSVEADVYVRCYALLVVHARTEEADNKNNNISCCITALLRTMAIQV